MGSQLNLKMNQRCMLAYTNHEPTARLAPTREFCKRIRPNYAGASSDPRATLIRVSCLSQNRRYLKSKSLSLCTQGSNWRGFNPPVPLFVPLWLSQPFSSCCVADHPSSFFTIRTLYMYISAWLLAKCLKCRHTIADWSWLLAVIYNTNEMPNVYTLWMIQVL